jgi:hypothetical protein
MSQQTDPVQRVMDGRAWEEFCDTLKAAGAVVLAPSTPNDPLDRAEGYRYLTRLLRAGLETYVEASDSEHPVFQRTTGETVKMGMDSPDNIYLNAPVNGAHDYRIWGTRGTVHYLGFGSQKGNYASTGSLQTTGYLEAKDMKLGPGGSFEIVASSNKPASDVNWLPMEPESRMIQIRQTRLDHAKEEPAQVKIERIGGAAPVKPLDPVRFDRMLQGAAKMVLGTARLFQKWSEGFTKHTNQLPRFPHEVAFAAGGDPNIAYYHSHWALAPDEALVVDLAPPECDFWNFQLANWWMESLDYRFAKIHLNKHTAHYAADGTVRAIVAHRDPGLPNWLDTCGHASGTMCVRWIRAKTHPDPRTRVVKLAELAR